MTDNIRIRVGVVLLDKSKILVVRMHRELGEDIYVLPGGGVNPGEDLFEAGVREVKEETNLDIEIKKILYLKTLHSVEDYALEIIFLGNIMSGVLRKGYDTENKGKNVLKDVKFIKVEDLQKINFHPKQLKKLLKIDFNKQFTGKTKYLGNHSYPEK